MQDTVTGIFMIRTQTSNLGQKHHPNLSWEEQKNQNVYKHLHLQNQNQNQRPMSDKMRPTMGKVNQMLEGLVEVANPPSPNPDI